MAARRANGVATLLLAVTAFTPALCFGQGTGTDRIVPTNKVLISGYGTVGYGYLTQEAMPTPSQPA